MHLEELRRVVTATRPAKDHTDPDQLEDEWWERARRVGLTPRRWPAVSDDESPTIVDEAARTPLFDHPRRRPTGSPSTTRSSPEAMCSPPSPTTPSPSTARDQLWVLPADQIIDLAEEFLSSERVLRLARSQRRSRE